MNEPSLSRADSLIEQELGYLRVDLDELTISRVICRRQLASTLVQQLRLGR